MQDLFTERLVALKVHQSIARPEKIDPEKSQAIFTPFLRLAMPVDASMQLAHQINKVREAILQPSNKSLLSSGAEVAPVKCVS